MQKPKFQSQQLVIINAPLEKVWEFNMDLSKIAHYHPRVNKVDLISWKQFREAGIAYKCHLADEKNTCIEKDIKIIPMQKIVTILPEDTMGMSKLLTDYIVETIFSKIGDNKTLMQFFHYYSTPSIKTKLLNLIIRPNITKQSRQTLSAIKRTIETSI
jgi:hypothetical protein